MAIARRAVLRAGGATALLSARGEAAGMAEATARAAGWLAAWDGQGFHRTATAGDAAGAAWLAEAAAQAGGRVDLESFSLDRIEPLRGLVAYEDRIISGVPMFDAPDTPRGGVEGLVSTPAGEGLIALTEIAPLSVYSADFVAMRRTARARAIVAVTRGGAPGLALLNAEAFRAPYGPAMLQVSSEAGEALAAAFARGAAMRVVAESRRVPATAQNVIVTVAGRDAARPKLVVMTPRSSWWQSSAERGGGLVCWLEALHAVLAEPPGRDVVFTANSGHELGHIGLDDFLARRPGWMASAHWVHFGANIGAAGGRLTVVSPDDDFRGRVAGALTEADVAAFGLAPKETVPNGETRDIHRAGGRYLTLVGTNRFFHLAQDRYPAAVDPAAVARIAAAARRVVLALSR